MTRIQIEASDVEAAARLLLGDEISLAADGDDMFTYETADGRTVTICLGAPDAVWRARQINLADPRSSITNEADADLVSRASLPSVTEEYKGFSIEAVRMFGPQTPGGRMWHWSVRGFRDGKWCLRDASCQPCATSEGAIKVAKRQIDKRLIPADEDRAARG